MRTFSFLALIAAVASASSNLYESYTFEQHMETYGLKFHPSELTARRMLFDKELARVREHNAKNLGWTEGMNKFSTMTAAEKKKYFGFNKRIAKNHKNILKNVQPLPRDFVMQPVEKLPKEVDWRKAGIVTAVKDQGYCGSCWAFASTATMESHVAKASGLLFDLSVEQVAMCTPNPDQCGGTGGCMGATSELAFEYVTNSTGLFQEYQYPYDSYYATEHACALPGSAKPVAHVNGYVQLPRNHYQAVMNAVATQGPVAIAVDASTWGAYSGGILSNCNQVNPDINHGVVLVGYGEENGVKYWLVRNSWSPSWGEKGYIRVLRTDDESSNCGSDITPQDGIACAGDNEPEKVCGTCGVIFDVSYPLNAVAL